MLSVQISVGLIRTIQLVIVMKKKNGTEASNIKRKLTRKGDCSRNASGEQVKGLNFLQRDSEYKV